MTFSPQKQIKSIIFNLILLTSFIPSYHDIIVKSCSFKMRQEVWMEKDPGPLHLCQQVLVWFGIGKGVTHCAKWGSYLKSQLSRMNCPGHLKKSERKSLQQFHLHLPTNQKSDMQLEVHVNQIQYFLYCPLWKNYFPDSSDSWHHWSSWLNLLSLPERQKEEKMEQVRKQHQLYDPLFRLFVSLEPFLAVSVYEIVLDL